MLNKLFYGCGEDSSKKSSSHKLKQAFEKLEEKEVVLQKKIAIEVERAKEFTKAKNKSAAMQCMVRKRFYEAQVQHIGSFQLRIHDQEKKLHDKLEDEKQAELKKKQERSNRKGCW